MLGCWGQGWQQGQGLGAPCTAVLGPGPGLQSLYSEVQVEQVWGGGNRYGKVQCIMSNGHMGLLHPSPTPLDRMIDRHDWKHLLPTTLLAGGKHAKHPLP